MDLPPFGGGVANAGRRYLTRQQGWKPLEAKGVTMYSFRHGYALRAHQQYGLSARIAARVMGHSVQTHNENYGTWADVDEIYKKRLNSALNLNDEDSLFEVIPSDLYRELRLLNELLKKKNESSYDLLNYYYQQIKIIFPL